MSISKTEWFGLISGSVGLVVDVLALATLPDLSVAPANIGRWVILFIGIAWTSVVVSVYATVFAIRRQRSRGGPEDAQITLGATLALTLLFSLPLLIGYYANLFTQFERTRATATAERSAPRGGGQGEEVKDHEIPLNSGTYVLAASVMTATLLFLASMFISDVIVGDYDENLGGLEGVTGA
jgi:hypothetical protein